MDVKSKDFDIDDIVFGNKKELNSDLKDLNDYDLDLPELEKDDDQSHEVETETENKDYYDTNYWVDTYSSQFKLEDLLQE